MDNAAPRPRLDEMSNPLPSSEIDPVSLRAAFAFWLKLGFISFGGPSGQIAIMHTELVERRRWISERRFLHALNYCMLLPGPEAQQLATYIGWLLHGTRGGIIAGALFVLPSLVLLIVLSWIYLAFGSLPIIAGVLDGMKPAVVAIVAFAAYRIGSRVLTSPLLWATAAGAFIALFFFAVPFPYIVIVAGALGFLISRLAPQALQSASVAHHAAATSHGPALIDDDDPPPTHARFSWPRIALIVGVALVLWLAVEGALIATFGVNSTFAQMGIFFTKAALLTFGGAYAVLPYVQQAAVEQYRWLTAPQMIDGLALGETTPGPLIMVVAFVGFVGGWTQAAANLSSPVLAGVLAAVIATYFTFLPSFVFILAGGPAVEATRDEISFTAPLTVITAAVVGVILNLAVYFAEHVLWPAGFAQATSASSLLGSLDVFAALLCIIASIALVRFKANVVFVILGCAVAGLLRTLLMQ
jgi:chromate transporter